MSKSDTMAVLLMLRAGAQATGREALAVLALTGVASLWFAGVTRGRR